MAMDRETYRQQSRETWGEMAPGWEARNEWMDEAAGRVNEWIVEKADPQPGQTVLELAAGPGALGFRVAGRVGDGGKVLSTDFSPEMVGVARRLGDARGLGNVEYRVLDAEAMDFDDESVDAVVCRWGYMLMADPAAALSESRRVLRRGGPLAFAVWAGPERNPWAALPAKVLVGRGHMPPPEPGAPGIFAMADPERIRDLVAGAGFGEPELAEIDFDFRYADADDLWEVLVRIAGPLARVVKTLPPEELQATRAAIEESLAPFRAEDGSYAVPALCRGALAR